MATTAALVTWYDAYDAYDAIVAASQLLRRETWQWREIDQSLHSLDRNWMRTLHFNEPRQCPARQSINNDRSTAEKVDNEMKKKNRQRWRRRRRQRRWQRRLSCDYLFRCRTVSILRKMKLLLLVSAVFTGRLGMASRDRCCSSASLSHLFLFRLDRFLSNSAIVVVVVVAVIWSLHL